MELSKPENEDAAPTVIGALVPWWFALMVVCSLVVIAAPASTAKFYWLIGAGCFAGLFMAGFMARLAKLGIVGRG